MAEATIDQTVNRLRNGDTTVMSDIYDSYASTLYAIVLKIVRSEMLAEDLLQETFVRVWTQRERYDSSKGTFFTWMLNIARNLSIDTIRSSTYKANLDNRTVDDIVGIDEPESSDRIIPETVDLRDLVKKLAPEQRQIIDLMYFRGYTQSEIADEYGIPLGTVKSRVRLAMQNLRTYFDDNPQNSKTTTTRTHDTQ